MSVRVNRDCRQLQGFGVIVVDRYGEARESAAALQAYFLRHRDSPENAIRDLLEWLRRDA